MTALLIPATADRLFAEADLCRNDGANDIAALLDDAGILIERLIGDLDRLIYAHEAVHIALDTDSSQSRAIRMARDTLAKARGEQ